MNVRFKIRNNRTGEFTKDYDSMMNKSGLDSKMGFEDVGIQAD